MVRTWPSRWVKLSWKVYMHEIRVEHPGGTSHNRLSFASPVWLHIPIIYENMSSRVAQQNPTDQALVDRIRMVHERCKAASEENLFQAATEKWYVVYGAETAKALTHDGPFTIIWIFHVSKEYVTNGLTVAYWQSVYERREFECIHLNTNRYCRHESALDTSRCAHHHTWMLKLLPTMGYLVPCLVDPAIESNRLSRDAEWSHSTEHAAHTPGILARVSTFQIR